VKSLGPSHNGDRNRAAGSVVQVPPPASVCRVVIHAQDRSNGRNEESLSKRNGIEEQH
jgi:hypothetical protein